MSRLHALFLAAVLLTSSACVVVIPSAAPAASPQRPTYSTNTRTTVKDTAEVEFGTLVDFSDKIALPGSFKLGVTEHSEVFFNLDLYQWVDTGPTDEHGIGDLVIGTRQRVSGGANGDPGYAYQLSTKLPTADDTKGLGSGETDFYMAGIADSKLHDLWLTSFCQLGLLGDLNSGGVDVEFGLAMAAEHPITYGLSGFGEMAGVFVPERDLEQIFGTFGVAYAVTDAFVFDSAIVVGLTSDAPNLQLLFGMTRNLGRVMRHP